MHIAPYLDADFKLQCGNQLLRHLLPVRVAQKVLHCCQQLRELLEKWKSWEKAKGISRPGHI